MERVRITDVSPRDGLQNEPLGPGGRGIATADKIRLVELLCRAGVDEVEVSSFVPAKWVPQLGDAAEVFAGVRERLGNGPRPLFSALVPNEKGMEAALAVNERAAGGGGAGEKLIGKVSVFTAASETFAHRNINASIAESIKRFEPVVAAAKRAGLLVRGYVSCVVACPFEGRIAPEKVAHVAQALMDLGVDELDLGDTIGAAEPGDVTLLLHGIMTRLGDDLFKYTTLHLHDTFGHAAECVGEALQLGIRSFDGSVAGLGGCPYASRPGEGGRAPGNISTETLVRRVREDGYSTGVDLGKLEEAAAWARGMVPRAR